MKKKANLRNPWSVLSSNMTMSSAKMFYYYFRNNNYAPGWYGFYKKQ